MKNEELKMKKGRASREEPHAKARGRGERRGIKRLSRRHGGHEGHGELKFYGNCASVQANRRFAPCLRPETFSGERSVYWAYAVLHLPIHPLTGSRAISGRVRGILSPFFIFLCSLLICSLPVRVRHLAARANGGKPAASIGDGEDVGSRYAPASKDKDVGVIPDCAVRCGCPCCAVG